LVVSSSNWIHITLTGRNYSICYITSLYHHGNQFVRW